MAEDDDSKILTTIKAALGLQPDYTPFDTEILMHINSALSTLAQLGVGPEDGFVADEDTIWSALLPDSKIESVKSYIWLKTKMAFDIGAMPPQVVSAYEKNIEELVFRLSVATDPMIPQEPVDLEDLEDEIIFDAGGA